jgi:hypothetical protein
MGTVVRQGTLHNTEAVAARAVAKPARMHMPAGAD